jgi:hypothetical protein
VLCGLHRMNRVSESSSVLYSMSGENGGRVCAFLQSQIQMDTKRTELGGVSANERVTQACYRRSGDVSDMSMEHPFVSSHLRLTGPQQRGIQFLKLAYDTRSKICGNYTAVVDM